MKLFMNFEGVNKLLRIRPTNFMRLPKIKISTGFWRDNATKQLSTITSIYLGASMPLMLQDTPFKKVGGIIGILTFLYVILILISYYKYMSEVKKNDIQNTERPTNTTEGI